MKHIWFLYVLVLWGIFAVPEAFAATEAVGYGYVQKDVPTLFHPMDAFNAPINSSFSISNIIVLSGPRYGKVEVNIPEQAIVYTADTTYVDNDTIRCQVIGDGNSYNITYIITQSNGASSQGTEFWVGFLEPCLYCGYEDPKMSFTASSLYEADVQIYDVHEIYYGRYVAKFHVNAGGMASHTIDYFRENNFGKRLNYNRGWIVTSSAPITLYAANTQPYSTDATNVLPTSSLGCDYILQSWDAPRTDLPAECVVIATENNTHVHISSPTELCDVTSKEVDTVLNRGMVYALAVDSKASTPSLNGIRITSEDNKKIAVFQGVRMTFIPYDGIPAGDHIYEQAIPVNEWGQDFVIPYLSRQGRDFVRFTASEDATSFVYNGENIILNARETRTCPVSNNDYEVVHANHPIICYLYSSSQEYLDSTQHSDPAMMVLNPDKQMTYHSVFLSYELANHMADNHYVILTGKNTRECDVILDGKPIGRGGAIEDTFYRRIEVQRGAHTLECPTGILAYAYGASHHETYAYAVASLYRELKDTFVVINDTICANEMYHMGSHFYNQTGIYLDTVRNMRWADSITELHLEVIPSLMYEITEYDTICHGGSYSWHGKIYTQDGFYTDTLTTIQGCDSITHLDLFVRQAQLVQNFWQDPFINNPIGGYPGVNFWDTICGESYTYLGKTYTQSGTYVDTLSDRFGCDSLISFHLEFATAKYVYCDTIVPYSDLPFVWMGKSHFTYGIYQDTLPTAKGCDSIGVLRLLYSRTYLDTIHVCENEPAIFNTPWGIIDAGDCDSLVGCIEMTLDSVCLTEAALYVVRDTICFCDTAYSHVEETLPYKPELGYTWFGQTRDTAGVYRDTLVGGASSGCDSIGTLILRVEYKDSISVCGEDTAAFTTPWGDYGVPRNLTCREEWIRKTTDGVGLVYARLCVTRLQPSASAKDTTVCADALPLIWQDSTWTAAGTKTKVLTNAVGCDSIVTLTLYVNQPTTSDTTAIACDSIVWHGITYTMSGDYDYQTTNAAGCDSTRTLHLTIHHASTGTNDTTVCRNDLPLLWADSTWTDAGVKTKILTNAAGCDSVVTLTLSVNEPTAGDTAAVACSSFTWYGQTYISSGSYTHMLTNAAGCDSTLTLQLTINQPTTGDTTAYVCAGTDFYWHGTLAQDGAQMTLTNAAGCDSVVTLHLITRPVYHQDVNLTVCDKQMPYTWNGITCTQAGDYVLDSATIAGCDSVVTLHLSVDVFSASDTAAAICRADLPYTWHGKQLHDAGTLKDTMVNSVLCDSIITLTLTVNEPTTSDTTATACSSFTWHGTTYTASGDYDYQTTNANGCDSTRTLHLTINQPTTGDTTAYVCAGTDYYWHGTLANDGAQMTLTNAAGCDSVVTLHLITKPVSSSAKDTTVCAEALPIVWADSTWTEAGTKIAILTNAAGCDSTITLTLHVNNHCCPDTIHNIAEVNICDTLLPYTWTAAHTLTIDQAGEYSDTLRNADGCDSILYFLTLTTYTCCAPMEATMQVPDVCADDASMEVTVTMQRGAFNSYRVHYTNAPGNAMLFRDTVINDAPADQSSPVTLTLPVPHDAADRTHYPRPDTYGIAMTLYDACGDSLHLASTTFDVLFPSWLLDQHWDDVIAILNDRYNGGYTFSDIRWLRDGEVIPGERELYIYLPHQLWTTPEEQHHDYAYQALLTRADDGKSILTCPMTPYHIDSTNVLTEPYVAVAPTIVSHENPVVHVMTNTQGTYWIYSLTGKLLRTADYEPCDHEVFDIRLFEAQTMYILVFTPRHETKPLKEKYRAVKVMVE